MFQVAGVAGAVIIELFREFPSFEFVRHWRSVGGMILVISFLTGAAATAAESQPHIEDCYWIARGSHTSEYARQGYRITYRLETPGPVWGKSTFGYHSDGILGCQDCVRGFPTRGLYHFGTNDSIWKEHGPKNVHERIERRSEAVGYPLKIVEGEWLRPLSFLDDLKIGRYTGYAILYQVDLPGESRWLVTSIGGTRELHVLALNLTDGCMIFETTMEMGPSPLSLEALVDSIVSGVRISREVQPLDEETRRRIERRDADPADVKPYTMEQIWHGRR